VTKKGHLNEIFSKALYADKTSHYSVCYRDYHSIIEVPLSDFLRISENFEFIPASRIVFVKREGQILYRKYYAGPLK
jgi:hypothetical protein